MTKLTPEEFAEQNLPKIKEKLAELKQILAKLNAFIDERQKAIAELKARSQTTEEE